MIYAVYSLLAIHLHIPTRSAVAPSRVSLPVAVASPFDTLSNRRTSFSSDDASGALSYEELVALERQTDALYQKEMLSGVYDERRRCFAITGGAKRYSITSTCFALLALDAEPERWHSAAAGRASARLDHLQVDAVLEARGLGALRPQPRRYQLRLARLRLPFNQLRAGPDQGLILEERDALRARVLGLDGAY